MRNLTRLCTAVVVLPVPAMAVAADASGVITHDGVRREFALHMPARPAASPPLVVVLHGGGVDDDPDDLIREVTRFDAKADSEGFVVVYPKAIEHHWNDGRGLARYRSQAQNVDDIGFLAALIEHLDVTSGIDRGRVYMAGASNGAMMTHRFACERSDRVAAIAAVIGNLPARLQCRPSRPVPALIVNGTEDPMMPWAGGDISFGRQRLGEVLSAEETAARWAGWNACTRPPVVETLRDRAPLDGTRVSLSTYAGCADGADVHFYRIDGGGHTWPSAPQVTGRRVVGRTSRELDATDVAWTFFRGRRRQVAAAADFGAPTRIQIRGYAGDAMEPAISRDGQMLAFNDNGGGTENKNLFWARRAGDAVFDFMGALDAVNSPAVEASPTLTVDGQMYFTSLRDYPRRFETLYRGRFDGRLTDVVPLTGDLYRQAVPWASLDPDLTPDGEALYFVQGRFGAGPAPAEMDLRVARRAGAGYELDPRGAEWLRAVNTPEHLEYAPAISADNLELFFTRAERLNGRPVRVAIFRAARRTPAEPFGPPAAVPAIAGFVEGPSLSADGLALYYHKKVGDRFVIERVTRVGLQRAASR